MLVKKNLNQNLIFNTIMFQKKYLLMTLSFVLFGFAFSTYWTGNFFTYQTFFPSEDIPLNLINTLMILAVIFTISGILVLILFCYLAIIDFKKKEKIKLE